MYISKLISIRSSLVSLAPLKMLDIIMPLHLSSVSVFVCMCL